MSSNLTLSAIIFLFVGSSPSILSVSCLPIGTVISSRAEIVDDDWDTVESQIKIDSAQFSTDALEGISSFSHIEVIFQMNQVDFRKI